jgi:pimeloyl-ACP methyl ester carboxylesterase
LQPSRRFWREQAEIPKERLCRSLKACARSSPRIARRSLNASPYPSSGTTGRERRCRKVKSIHFGCKAWQEGIRPEYECIKAFSETDFRGDLTRITVPTLLIQGDDDQIVPIDLSSRRSQKLIPKATLKE